MNARPSRRSQCRREVREQLARCREDQGESRRSFAQQLSLPVSTVSRWCRTGRSPPLPGRPRRPLRREDLEAVRTEIVASAARTPVAALKRSFPRVSRCVLEREKARIRRDLNIARKAHLAALTWLLPGSVWAADFTKLGGRRDDSALAVRDLPSAEVLHADAVPSQDRIVTVEALAGLFEEHGPPLVLKMDNGSGFIAGDTKRLLAVYGVLALYSPPGTPAYNGACERGIGTLKEAAADVALIEGHVGALGAAQLDQAARILNVTPRGRTLSATCAHDRWAGRSEIHDSLRNELHQLVEQHRQTRREELHLAPCAELDHAARASIDRYAIPDHHVFL